MTGFFDLPPELRVTVYTKVQSEVRKREICDYELGVCFVTRSMPMAFLTTCRTVYIEAKEILEHAILDHIPEIVAKRDPAQYYIPRDGLITDITWAVVSFYRRAKKIPATERIAQIASIGDLASFEQWFKFVEKESEIPHECMRRFVEHSAMQMFTYPTPLLRISSPDSPITELGMVSGLEIVLNVPIPDVHSRPVQIEVVPRKDAQSFFLPKGELYHPETGYLAPPSKCVT